MNTASGHNPQRPPSRDFGAVGRRISGWTLNGLATALVIVLGLAGGRQIIQWWREDPQLQATAPDQPVQPAVSQIDFGSTRVVSQPLTGDSSAALRQLRELCARFGNAAPAPAGPPQPAEQRLLNDIAQRTAVAEIAGCRLDELAGFAPLVAATREFAAPPSLGATTPVRRVVALGMALPLTAGEWSLYVFPPPGRQESQDDLPLPPGSQTILALRPDRGPTIIAFGGGGELPAWRSFFDGQATAAGWQPISDWQPTPTGEQALFSVSTPARLRLELKIGTDGPGHLRGFAVLTPEP